MGEKENQRPNLGLAIWLLERMNARERPITVGQVDCFGRHPAGPILPDLCLETRRLPADYGTRFDLCPNPRPVLALSATPEGEPCIGTIVIRQPMIFVGEKGYKLGEEEAANQSMGTTTKCDSIRILGFVEGEPVTMVTTSFEGSADHYPAPTTKIFQGEQLRAKGVVAASLLSDGSLVYAEDPEENLKIPPMCEEGDKLFRDGKFVCEIYVGWRFVLSPDGRLISMGHMGCPASVNYVMPLTIDEKSYYLRDRVVDLVMFRGNLHWVQERGDSRSPCSWYAAPFGSSSKRTWGVRLGYNPYFSHLTALDDVRLAYIGETMRDNMKCWVVDGVEQLGFEHVSPLFQRGEDWCYWGAIGRHLCLMEIPRH